MTSNILFKKDIRTIINKLKNKLPTCDILFLLLPQNNTTFAITLN